VGVVFRFLLYAVGAHDFLKEHLELSTPITSSSRLEECLFLLDEGISPYVGDICHHTPLLLWLLLPLRRHAPALARFAAIVAVDLAVALLLRTIAAQYAAARARAGPSWVEAQVRPRVLTGEAETEAADVAPPSEGDLLSPAFVGLLYFLNPITLASCAAQSLQNVQHLSIAASIALAGAGRGGASASALAAALYLCPWTPVVLVLPCAWLAYCHWRPYDAASEATYTRSKKQAMLDGKFLVYLAIFAVTVLVLFGCLMGASLAMMGGETHFLNACFISVLRVQDLTPNVGFFWYLFCEVFDRFRALFQFSFHGHLLFYIAPMHLRLGRHRPLGPFMQAVVAIALVTQFKTYPTASDHALSISALLIPGEVLKESETRFVFLMGGQLFGLCMFPTMVTVWLGRNAGNANFLYNMTLVIAIFGCYLLVDWMQAAIRLRKRQRLSCFCRGIVEGALDDALAKGGPRRSDLK